jgi:hypothetical protein
MRQSREGRFHPIDGLRRQPRRRIRLSDPALRWGTSKSVRHCACMRMTLPFALPVLATVLLVAIPEREASGATPVLSNWVSVSLAHEEPILIRRGHGRHAARGRHGRARGHSHHRRFRAGHIRRAFRARSAGGLHELTGAAVVGSGPIFGSSVRMPEAQVPRRIASVSEFDSMADVNRSKALDCEVARTVVSGYAFSSVSPTNCSGPVYAFEATRANKTYAVRLSASTGEIVNVQKLPSEVLPGPSDRSSSIEPPLPVD